MWHQAIWMGHPMRLEVKSEPKINGNEEKTPYSSKLQNWSLTIQCSLVTYPGHPLFFWGRGSYLFARDAFGVFLASANKAATKTTTVRNLDRLIYTTCQWTWDMQTLSSAEEEAPPPPPPPKKAVFWIWQ